MAVPFDMEAEFVSFFFEELPATAIPSSFQQNDNLDNLQKFLDEWAYDEGDVYDEWDSRPDLYQIANATGITIALTGVSGTGSVGTVIPNSTIAITQNSGTGSVGTVIPVLTNALTQVLGTGAVGSVSVSTAVALTQNSVTGSVGSVTPTNAEAISGTSGTGSVGTVTPSFAFTLSQVTGAGSVTTVSPSNVVGITEVAGFGSVGSVPGGDSDNLTQVFGTGSVGSVTPSLSVALTGVVGTGSVGTVSPSIGAVIALTGVSGTGTIGTIVPGGAIPVTIVSGTGAVGTVTPSIAFAIQLSGVSGTGSVGNVSGYAYRDIWTENGLVVNVGLISEPSIEWVTSSTVPYGGVVGVNPNSGTTVNQWTPVTLLASVGPPNTVQTVQVPNVVGLQSYQARVACSNAGLNIDNYVYQNTNGVVDPTYVVSQSLIPGEIVTFGTLITLTVSNG
jgi:hypothetical protein